MKVSLQGFRRLAFAFASFFCGVILLGWGIGELAAARPPAGLALTPPVPQALPASGGGVEGSGTAEANATFGLTLVDLDGDGDLDIVTKDVTGRFFLNANQLGTFASKLPLYPDLPVSFASDAEPGEVVASFLTFDPDDANGEDSYAYTLVNGEGDTHNDSFEIDSNGSLRLKAIPTTETLHVRVRVTDLDGLFLERTFSLAVNAAGAIESALKHVVRTTGVELEVNGSAVARGEVLASGGGTVQEAGFLVSESFIKDANATGVRRNIADLNGTAFSLRLSGLEPGRHYVRAYARSGTEESLGSIIRVEITEAGTSSPTPDVTSGPWAGASVEADGWLSVSWFGSFLAFSNGWIYHADMGWLYASGQTADNLWLWQETMGWLWTTREIFPYLHRHDGTRWVYFLKPKDGRLYFYQADEGTVFSVLR